MLSAAASLTVSSSPEDMRVSNAVSPLCAGRPWTAEKPASFGIARIVRSAATCSLLSLTLPTCAEAASVIPAPAAHLVVEWEPLDCGSPGDVVVMVTDEVGETLRSSAPCSLGIVAIELWHWGIYYARACARRSGRLVCATPPTAIAVDDRWVRLPVATPQWESVIIYRVGDCR